MRGVMGLVAIVMACGACVHDADNCHNTRTCEPSPDAGTTVVYVVSDAGVGCDGVCVPALADVAGWSPQPFMLWRGTAVDLPDTHCPKNAPNPSQVWYSSPDQSPLACPTCSCAPSTGVCMLPESMTVSASLVCPSDAGDAGAPFDPPSEWDGGCTTNDAIAVAECDGGSCLATVGPMAPIQDGCMPISAVVPKKVTWGNAAFGCAGGANKGTCNDPGDVCVLTPPLPSSGFNICVSRQDDDPLVECPLGYPVRNVFYLEGADTRGCAPCDCEPPQGSACSSLVSVYSDSTCSMQVGSVTANSAGPVCVSVPADSPLGSKQASPPIYTSGSCKASGGEGTGSVQSNDPFTFCCQQ